MDPLCWAIACVIRLWRKQNGVTQSELSRRTGISRPMIGDIECQKSTFTMNLLRRMARGMGMQPEELVKLGRLWWELKNPLMNGGL